MVTAIESLSAQIITEISYINTSITFYIYSLTSKKFRREVSRIFSSLFTCRFYNVNRVQPVPIQLKTISNEPMVKKYSSTGSIECLSQPSIINW